MYSVIGLLSRPVELSVTEWRAWWTQLHVPKVLALPGLIDYVIWPIDEELDQVEQTFREPSYAGVAIITFESKKAFLEAIESPEGHADLDSFNSSAPRSLVLCGQPFVQRAGLR